MNKTVIRTVAGAFCSAMEQRPLQKRGASENPIVKSRENSFLYLLIFPLFLSFSSCVSYRLFTDMSMANVSINGDNSSIASQDDDYEDDNFNITITNSLKTFTIKIKNKTMDAAYIIWDESAIIYPDNTSKKIVTGDTKFINAEKNIVASVVPPQSSIIEYIYVIDQIYYNTPQHYNGIPLNRGGWQVSSIFPKTSKSKSKLLKYYKDLKGAEMKMFIRIKKNEQNFDYFITLNINDIRAV